jgi:two-component system KDP operon response regulator KdpE
VDAAESLPAHILVVDDDPGILGFLAALLESEGFRVSTAADGGEALRQAQLAPPDVILLDLAMPVMNGWQVNTHLRDRTSGPAVIFMSAGHDPQREAALHGVDGHLAKPFTADQLLDCIARVLHTRTSARARAGRPHGRPPAP